MTKRIVISATIFIILGVLAFYGVITYQVLILKMDDSIAMGEMIRSDKVKNWSLLFSLASMILATWLATRKLDNKIYLTAAILIVIDSAAITVGPTKLISMHANYLPILIGGFIGAVISLKLNKSMQPTAETSAD